MKKMILTKLTLSGQGKQDAHLSFTNGLNVISGDSDTGKTYAFQCLDYMLGKENPPKDILEAHGYSIITLEFKVENESYKIQRRIGENKFIVFHNNNTSALSYKHDPSSTENLSRYLLNILLESKDNIFVRTNAQKKVRTLSFRDMVHLCLISETDIIAEISAFQSIQYTEKTVRNSILKYIITGQDDSLLKIEKNTTEETIRRAGVVQFLERKKIEIEQNISTIENDERFKLYTENASLNDAIIKIQMLRKEIASAQHELTQLNVETSNLNKLCIEDEDSISKFKKLEEHYRFEQNKIDMLSSYEDFVSQLPQVACPFCKQPIDHHALHDEEIKELYEYWSISQQELQEKRTELLRSIKDVEDRLRDNLARLQELTKQRDRLNSEIKNKENEIRSFSESIAQMRELDEMKNTLKLLRKELLSVVASIEEYSKKVVKEKENFSIIDSRPYENYCGIIAETLRCWGFAENPQVEFNPNSLDLIIDGKSRDTWGKGYRAFIMSAMAVSLMRYCSQYNRLHPGFVIIDSPLVSLKERKKDENSQWIDLYMEKKMIADILSKDSQNQVIIFENKDLKFDFDYNYVEYSHESDTLNGFIPK